MRFPGAGGCRDKQPQQRAQRGVVDRLATAQLYAPHALAGAFQEARRVFQRRAMEKPDVHMSGKGVDISKCSAADAGGGRVKLAPASWLGAKAVLVPATGFEPVAP